MGQTDQMKLQKEEQQQLFQQVQQEQRQQADGLPPVEALLQQEQQPVQRRAPLPDEAPQEPVEIGGQTVQARMLARVEQEVEQAMEEIRQQEIENEEIERAVERMMPQQDPAFRIYNPQELAAMGKIRRRYHQYRQNSWNKKLAIARNAARSMLRMRQPDNEDWDEEYATLAERMDAHLNQTERQRARIYHRNARFFDAWARLITTHDEFNKDFFFPLQIFGMASEFEHEEGHFNYAEQVNGYLRGKENLHMLDEHLQQKIHYNGIPKQAEALVKGLKMAKLPYDMVLHKKVSMEAFNNMLDFNMEGDGEATLQKWQHADSDERHIATREIVDASMFPLQGEKDVEMIILARKGTQALPLGGTPINQRMNRNRNTVIIAPDTQLLVFKVEKKEGDGQGWRVYAETVPHPIASVE